MYFFREIFRELEHQENHPMSPYTASAAALFQLDQSVLTKIKRPSNLYQTCSFDLSFFEGNIEINARLVMLLNDFERDFRVWVRGS